MNLKKNHIHLSKSIRRTIFFSLSLTAFVLVIVFSYLQSTSSHKQVVTLQAKEKNLNQQLLKTISDYESLKNQDQYKRNQKLQQEINDIVKTYKDAVGQYESLLKLQDQIPQPDKTINQLENLFATALSQLSARDYTSASATLVSLKDGISKKQAEIAASFTIPANVPVNNTAPGSGYSRQSVQSDVGTFLIDIIAADFNSARVVVDTASGGDCSNNCPVLPLATYAGRSGAFAAVNGPYFCPAAYPSCAGKTNSFDTLLMNKNKVYFNTANNVYSTVPAVIFSGSSARYVGQSLEWGRDTGVDAVIANQPLLVSGGNVVFGGDEEAKRSGAGTRLLSVQQVVLSI